MTTEKDIGYGIKKTASKAVDRHDPFAGGFGVRGATLTGTVTSAKATNTVTVQIVGKKNIPKYNRSVTRTYKVHAHNPETMDAREGDIVKMIETRPVSKTKHFCVVEIVERKET